jgi:hypothetical protein
VRQSRQKLAVKKTTWILLVALHDVSAIKEERGVAAWRLQLLRVESWCEMRRAKTKRPPTEAAKDINGRLQKIPQSGDFNDKFGRHDRTN